MALAGFSFVRVSIGSARCDVIRQSSAFSKAATKSCSFRASRIDTYPLQTHESHSGRSLALGRMKS